MILSDSIYGNILSVEKDNRITDFLELEWFETENRIFRKYTTKNQEIGFRNLSGAPLKNGDIIFEDDSQRIVVKILPCKCIIFSPQTSREMASIAFEIGNRHLPISFSKNNEIVIAHEVAVFHLFEKKGYAMRVEERIIEQAQTLKMHQWSKKTKFKITLKTEQ